MSIQQRTTKILTAVMVKTLCNTEITKNDNLSTSY